VKINICIPFNDLTPPGQIGMVVGKKPSYYNQLVYLIKSIKKNWDSNLLDYSIHVFHSRELKESKKNQLEALGCEVINDAEELIPYLCRENIFKHSMDGDYTLVLDTDMIVLKTPCLEYEKDIYVRKAGNQAVGNIDKLCGLMDPPPKGKLHFNAGCILIKNSIKHELYKRSYLNREILDDLLKQNRHLGMQVYISLLIQGFSWGFLDKGINVFSQELGSVDRESVSILHYLGEQGYTEKIKKIIETI